MACIKELELSVKGYKRSKLIPFEVSSAMTAGTTGGKSCVGLAGKEG